MTIIVGPVDAVSGAPNYTGEMARQTFGGGLVGGKTSTRPLGGRTGVWPGTPTNVVTISGLVVTVGVHGGVMDVETSSTAGPYQYAVSVAQTVTINALPSSPNSRVDLISLQLSDPAEGDGTSTPGVAVVYTAGTAANPGVAPSPPSRSMVLAQVNVPNAGSATISWVAPYTVAAGGIVVCTSTARPSSPYEGMGIFETDTNLVQFYDGSAWQPVTPGGPLGDQGVATGPGSTTAFSATATVATLTVPVVAGRSYLFTTNFVGTQTSASGIPTVHVLAGGAEIGRLATGNTYTTSSAVAGSVSYVYHPSSSGNVVFSVTAQDSAGAITITANACQVAVTDIGLA